MASLGHDVLNAYPTRITAESRNWMHNVRNYEIWLKLKFHSKLKLSWWRHQMETYSSLLAICVGNSLVPGEFPAQRPMTRSFEVFFDLRLNIRLSKQSWGRWFETQSCPLWRQCNDALETIHLQIDDWKDGWWDRQTDGPTWWIQCTRPTFNQLCGRSIMRMTKSELAGQYLYICQHTWGWDN